jgi:hypothetical protein
MHVQKRYLRILIYAVLLAVSTVAAISGRAQAATGSEDNVPFTFGSSPVAYPPGTPVVGSSVLPVTFTAGDCRQMGANQDISTSVTLLAPQDNNSTIYTFDWHTTEYTVHSFTSDLWHGSWAAKDSAGNTLFTIAIDGQPLPGSGQHVIFSKSKAIQLDPFTQVFPIATIKWMGDC